MSASRELPLNTESEHSGRSEQDDALPTPAEILSDRATSHWLRDALETALDRDPVDALNDALLLAAVLEQHLRDVLGIDVDLD